MTTIELNVQERASSEKASKVRELGFIPAVIYGPKEEAKSLKVPYNEFLRVWHRAGESTIVDLKGLDENKEVLIKDVQWHPVKDTPIHIDFYAIERGKTLTLTVPLEFVGEAPAEKKGGVVVRVMHELEIETRPRNIPQHIEVDLSSLEDLDSVITVADIKMPEGVEALADKDEVVVSVSEQAEELEEATQDESTEEGVEKVQDNNENAQE